MADLLVEGKSDPSSIYALLAWQKTHLKKKPKERKMILNSLKDPPVLSNKN